MAERRLCTFRLADLRIGIDVGRVQEVLADPHVTPVPLAGAAVAGLLNLRGQILTVIDGRARLGLPPRRGPGERHVILQAGGENVSFVVDADDEVVDIDGDAIEEMPTTVSESIRGCALGTYRMERDLVVLLDIDLVLA